MPEESATRTATQSMEKPPRLAPYKRHFRYIFYSGTVVRSRLSTDTITECKPGPEFEGVCSNFYIIFCYRHDSSKPIQFRIVPILSVCRITYKVNLNPACISCGNSRQVIAVALLVASDRANEPYRFPLLIYLGERVWLRVAFLKVNYHQVHDNLYTSVIIKRYSMLSIYSHLDQVAYMCPEKCKTLNFALPFSTTKQD